MSNNKNAIIYQSLRDVSTYLKCNVDNLLNKSFFINIRDNFHLEYQNACKFYNSSNVSDLINYSLQILNNDTKNLIDDGNNEETRKVITNQYESLSRAIQSSYSNLNIEMILNIIDCVSDVEAQKNNLTLIIKGLILLQIIYSILYIIDKTIENNYKFDYINEHKSSYFPEILEHISEIYSSFHSTLYNETNTLLESDEIEFNNQDLFNDEYKESSEAFKQYNFDNDDNEDDLTYSSNDLDNYIQKIYSKAIKSLKEILDKIISSDNYYFLPKSTFIMYITTIIAMIIVNKF